LPAAGLPATGGRGLPAAVLVANTDAVAFWQAVGYRDYSLKLEIVPK